jgi:ERCC4-type nuclease
MKVVIDTREKNPWKLPGIRSVRKPLKFGDYAVSGRERVCVVERKSGADLVGSLTAGFHRFCREVIGAREAGVRLFVVVDADMDYARFLMSSHYPGRRLDRCLAKFALTTGAVPVFAGSRTDAAQVGLAILARSLELPVSPLQ